MAYNHYKEKKPKDSSKDVQEELLEKGLSVSVNLMMKKGTRAAYRKVKGNGRGKVKGKNNNKKKTDGDEDEEYDGDDNLVNIEPGGMNAGPRGNQGYYDQGQFGNQNPQGQPEFQTSGRGMNHGYVGHSQGNDGGQNGPGTNANPNQAHPNYDNPEYGGPSNVNQGYAGPTLGIPIYRNNGNWAIRKSF